MTYQILTNHIGSNKVVAENYNGVVAEYCDNGDISLYFNDEYLGYIKESNYVLYKAEGNYGEYYSADSLADTVRFALTSTTWHDAITGPVKTSLGRGATMRYTVTVTDSSTGDPVAVAYVYASTYSKAVKGVKETLAVGKYVGQPGYNIALVMDPIIVQQWPNN